MLRSGKDKVIKKERMEVEGRCRDPTTERCRSMKMLDDLRERELM